MDRRTLIGVSLSLGLGALALGVSGCSAGSPKLATSDLARRPADAGVNDAVRASVSDVSGKLLAAVERDTNVVMSPLSVLIVLAMVRNGATGQTADEMDATLTWPDLDTLNTGVNTTLQTLATRNGKRVGPSDRSGEVVLDLAQMAWGQRGITWLRPFLDVLAQWYGTGMAEIDFTTPETAATTINEWVAGATHDKITDLIGAGDIGSNSELALANALYLKAPWQRAFEQPAEGEFTTTRGAVRADMMSQDSGIAYGRGADWEAATIPYLGTELAMTVVLPAQGRSKALLEHLGDGGLTSILTGMQAASVAVTMPTFSVRSGFDLIPTLSSLGMSRLFTDQAELTEMTERTLKVATLVHQGWIKVDEQGTEAAAATVAVMVPVSANIDQRVLVADRPFAWIVHDVESRLPLLVGWVSDPTQTAD
ncbi:MAG: serpin family protein [Propionibacteriales bacterium]|nr:serpin family protein [Propionibacteriales bacterium]